MMGLKRSASVNYIVIVSLREQWAGKSEVCM